MAGQSDKTKPQSEKTKEKKEKKEEKEHLNHLLDEGLDESFPASDPPAVTVPGHENPAGDKKR